MFGRDLEGGGDFAIAGRFALGPGVGVEIGFDERREIAGSGVGKEKFLGEDAAGRKNGKAFMLCAPSSEGGGYVGIDFAF